MTGSSPKQNMKPDRKFLYHSKWTMAAELRNRWKGNVNMDAFYKGKNHEAYLPHAKIQITASRKNIYLVLVYGITEHPMMLATNMEGSHHKNSRSSKAKSFLLLLPAGKRYPWHTVVCERRHQALVQNKAFCIPSTPP